MFLVPFVQMVTPRNVRVGWAERLRRSGYADGERTPKQPKHWANS